MESLFDNYVTFGYQDSSTDSWIEQERVRIQLRWHKLLELLRIRVQEFPTPGESFLDLKVSPNMSLDLDTDDHSLCWLKTGEEENQMFYFKFATATNCKSFMEIFKQAMVEMASKAKSKKRVAADAPPGKLNVKFRGTEKSFVIDGEFNC